VVIILSKKSSSNQKAQHAKQLRKQAKKNRQKHDPLKWEEKKQKRKASQQNKWDVQYSRTHSDCPLSLSVFPSKCNCKGCTLQCTYNPN